MIGGACSSFGVQRCMLVGTIEPMYYDNAKNGRMYVATVIGSTFGIVMKGCAPYPFLLVTLSHFFKFKNLQTQFLNHVWFHVHTTHSLMLKIM
jgi:hypothetical protein